MYVCTNSAEMGFIGEEELVKGGINITVEGYNNNNL